MAERAEMNTDHETRMLRTDRQTIASLAALACVAAIATSVLIARPAGATGGMIRIGPSVTGVAREGSILYGYGGHWENGGTTVIRWQRCDSRGKWCADIVPAEPLSTGSISSYIVTASDVDHSLRVAVTWTNESGAASGVSGTTAVVSSSAPPVSTDAPTISGKPKVGARLSASTGTWTGGVRSYAYRWQRCDSAVSACAPIARATSPTYVVRAIDASGTLRVVVTARSLGGSTKATAEDGIRIPAAKNRVR